MCVYARHDSQSTVAMRIMSVKTRRWLRMLLGIEHICNVVSVVKHAASSYFLVLRMSHVEIHSNVCVYTGCDNLRTIATYVFGVTRPREHCLLLKVLETVSQHKRTLNS